MGGGKLNKLEIKQHHRTDWSTFDGAIIFIKRLLVCKLNTLAHADITHNVCGPGAMSNTICVDHINHPAHNAGV